MDKHYQLSITSDTTDINVTSTDSAEVARIVQLAGLPTPSTGVTPPPTPPAADTHPSNMPAANIPPEDVLAMDGTEELPQMDESDTCAICGGDDHDEHTCPAMTEEIDILDEEIAEFDHGNTEHSDTGEEIEVNDYVWKGSKLPQRIVKGGQGDNPLISELHQKFIKDYNLYLSENENEDGTLSPLSDPTKPDFDKDPMRDVEAVTDGSHSPMSTIKRQHAFK
jgi:hypothetical protein